MAVRQAVSQAQWYGGLILGTLPLLLLAFLMSTLANRLAFAGWGVATALLYTAVFRQGVAAGWKVRRVLGSALAVLAVAVAGLSGLAAVYREALVLGTGAFLPPRLQVLFVAPWVMPVLFLGLGLLLATLLARTGSRRLNGHDEETGTGEGGEEHPR